MVLNLEKSVFRKNNLKYYGFMFSEEGMKPEPGKIQKIQETPAPESKKAFESFLGLTKYMKRFVLRCAIWYHLYNLKNVKSTHGGVLILVKLRASACNFTKINILPWVFSTFFKLYKWYQIAQRITFMH